MTAEAKESSKKGLEQPTKGIQQERTVNLTYKIMQAFSIAVLIV